MIHTFKTLIVSSTLAVALLTSAAFAVPITGQITFNGVADFGGPAVVDTYANATSIAFPFAVDTEHLTATGSYAGILAATTATFSGFTFGAPGSTGAVAVSPLWTFTDAGTTRTYSFNLTSITLNTVVGTQRNLEGQGMAFITGVSPSYDQTPATWSLSSSGTDTRISFSSATQSVPEGGSAAALTGLAMLGLFASRRFFVRA